MGGNPIYDHPGGSNTLGNFDKNDPNIGIMQITLQFDPFNSTKLTENIFRTRNDDISLKLVS